MTKEQIEYLKRLPGMTQHEHVTTATCLMCLDLEAAAVEAFPALLTAADRALLLEDVLAAAKQVRAVADDAGVVKDGNRSLNQLQSAIDRAEGKS